MRLFACLFLLLSAVVPSAAEQIGLPLWILDKDDNYVEGHSAEQLVVSVDGSEVGIRGLKGPGDNLVFMVVLDVVNDLQRVNAAREALMKVFVSWDEKHYVSLLHAQDGLRVIQDPTPDRGQLREKLAAVPVSGFADLLTAVPRCSAIADQILRESGVRVAVLFVTDGAVQNYREDYTGQVINPSDRRDLSRRFRDQLIDEKIEAIAKTLESSVAPLFFLHLNYQDDQLNQTYQNGIIRLAEITKGEALFARSLAEIPQLVERLAGRAANTYVLTLDSPKDSDRRLQLEIESNRNVKLLYRHSIQVAN